MYDWTLDVRASMRVFGCARLDACVWMCALGCARLDVHVWMRLFRCALWMCTFLRSLILALGRVDWKIINA